MLDNNLIQSTSSWPFVEVRKLLKDRKSLINKKNKITFQTGYGPSGLPKFFFNTSSLGILSGTFLSPSISSENVINS